MTRAELLARAAQYVTKDRNTEYGEPEDSFTTIGEFWTTYFRAKLGNTAVPLQIERIKFDSYDVAAMMILVKNARIALRPKDADSAIDIAGYAACLGEIMDNEVARTVSPPMATRAPPPIPAPASPEQLRELKAKAEQDIKARVHAGPGNRAGTPPAPEVTGWDERPL